MSMKGPKTSEVKETPEQRALAETGARWAEISDRLLGPVQSRFRDLATDTEPMATTARNRAAVDSEIAFGDAVKPVMASQIRAGATPGSGRFKGAVVGLSRDAGASRGATLADVDAASEDQAVQNRQALIDQGTGSASRGAAGLGRAAQVSTNQSFMDARAAAARRGATQNLIGTATGLGAMASLDADSLDQIFGRKG